MKIKLSTIRNFFIVFIMVFMSACQDVSSVDYLPEHQDPLVTPKITPTEPAKPTIAVFVSIPETAADEISLLEVLKTRIFKNDPGAYRVIGFVRNNTQQLVTNIKVEIQIFDASNQLRTTGTTQTSIISLAPGEISPFVLWTNEILPSDVYAIGSVIDYLETEFQRAEVVVRKELITIDDRNDVHVTGEFYNNNLFPILINGLAAATLDLDGYLLTADSLSVFSNYLDPGEVSPFRVTMPGPGEVNPTIMDHMVFIDARVTSPEDYIEIGINKNLNHFIDQSGVFHLVGEISNNSNNPLNVSLLAAIYDSNGNIIDASTTRLPLNSIYPGKTLPFDFDLWGPLSYKYGTIDSAERYSVQWDPVWTWASDTNYATLTITEESHQINPTNGIFSGAVANFTEFQVSSATVIVSIYDGNNGKLLAMNAKEIIEEISAGSSINYEVNLNFANSIDFESADIRIIAFGKIPQ
jgi:hypothetical protein